MEALVRVAEEFGLDISPAEIRSFGHGLIHQTWRVEAAQGPRLLQRLNGKVFSDPGAMAENAAAAAVRLDDSLRRRGDDDPRHRLVYLSGPGNRPWHRDAGGAFWRAAVLIPDSRPPDPTHPTEVFAAAKAFGQFPELVASGSGPDLDLILPGFHDTPTRLASLVVTVTADPVGRASGCRRESSLLLDMAPLAQRLADSSLPVRPVHNDAKLDNVLVDVSTGEALCVVDLDTVMPGLVAHDFGDLIRSAVTGQPEDEPDLDRIKVQTDSFRQLATGYMEGASGWIDPAERNSLFDGALVITFEQALRFLTDYLEGDAYYPIDDPDHNLRRARAQIRLLEELLIDEADLKEIVDLA